MIVWTGVDLIIAGIFIENQPGVDIGNVTGDIDFFSKDENLWKIVYGVVGFVGDIDIAIDKFYVLAKSSSNLCNTSFF